MKYIIGVDEVGYGSWAGPIYVGAVRAPEEWVLKGLQDSKKLSRERRAELTDQLYKISNDGIIDIKLSFHNNEKIDELGLGVCHKQCFTEAINELFHTGDTVILDGNLNPTHLFKYGLKMDIGAITSIVKADNLVPTVMAASIIAKHTRDMHMISLHNKYPEYEWDKNVGYIVPNHLEAVRKYRLSPLHRKSYNVKL